VSPATRADDDGRGAAIRGNRFTTHLKMLIGAASDDILGFTAFGFEASELMAAVQTAMLGRMPYTVLRDAIFAHPTMSEGLIGLLASVPAKRTQRAA
jgi:pyruvate/2-oxoglutarate dehydrogenase complex dihydrolipoamide dehydrogenase (E3) component